MLNGRLWFFATNPTLGQRSLYVSDGTNAGTVALRSFDSEGFFNVTPPQFTALNGMVYFSAFTTKHGTELWQSDGTIKGTTLTADLNRGVNLQDPASSSRPVIMGSQGNHLIFHADNGRNISQSPWSNEGLNELYFLPNASTELAGLPTTSVTYVATNNSQTDVASVLIAPQAIVVDANTNYARSVVTIRINEAFSGDSLSIRNQGAGAEQVAVSGPPTNRQMRVGGVLVATANDGTSTTPLTIRFNHAATQTAIQAVVRAISFSNSLKQPPIGSRSIEIGIVNGLGAPAKPFIVGLVVQPSQTLQSELGIAKAKNTRPAVQSGR